MWCRCGFRLTGGGPGFTVWGMKTKRGEVIKASYRIESRRGGGSWGAVRHPPLDGLDEAKTERDHYAARVAAVGYEVRLVRCIEEVVP